MGSSRSDRGTDGSPRDVTRSRGEGLRETGSAPASLSRSSADRARVRVRDVVCPCAPRDAKLDQSGVGRRSRRFLTGFVVLVAGRIRNVSPGEACRHSRTVEQALFVTKEALMIAMNALV